MSPRADVSPQAERPPRPLRLLVIITGLQRAGAEIALLNVMRHLDRARIEPHVVSLGGDGEVGPLLRALDVPVTALGLTARPAGLAGLRRLPALVAALRPDVVHTWMYHADLLGGVAARLARAPAVAWFIHNGDLSPRTTRRATRLTVRALAWLSRRVPDVIVSCSRRAAELHVQAGYDRQRIRVIPNGLDVGRFAPDARARTDVRGELGLDAATPLVGLFARNHPLKNHAGFVAAAASVARDVPRAHFVLAGAGIDERADALVAAIDAAGLRGRFHLLGPRSDMPRLMAALDVLVSASTGEAFPLAIGEGMACGVPCVVTDVGDSAEIVADAGRVVPPSDIPALAAAIVGLLRLAPGERARLGARARESIVARYRIDHVTRQLEALYEEIAPRREASPETPSDASPKTS